MTNRIWDEEEEERLFSEEEVDAYKSGKSKKPTTRKKSKENKKKRALPDVLNKSNPDDDAPEELTMTQGKDVAQKLRIEERENKKRVAAKAKNKRQEREVKRKEEKMSRKHVDAFETKDQDALGLLDDSIVQFLSEHEKAMSVETESKPSSIGTPHKRTQVKNEKPKEKDHGRVQVVRLDRDDIHVQQSALDFKHNHLFGSRIKRDSSMLLINLRASLV